MQSRNGGGGTVLSKILEFLENIISAVVLFYYFQFSMPNIFFLYFWGFIFTYGGLFSPF